MSDQLPSLPLFVDDYEAATAHLTVEEDGAYMRLLRLCWRTPRCSIPDDPEWIMRRLRVDRATYDRLIVPIIGEFFKRSRGRVFQKRLLQEFDYAVSAKRAKKEAGKKGGIAKAQKNNEKQSSNASILPEANAKQSASPQPQPQPHSITLADANDELGKIDPVEPPVEPDPPDPDKLFWDGAKAYLGASRASMIGKWVKNHGREAAAKAITEAQVNRAVDPIPYIERVLRGQAATASEPGLVDLILARKQAEASRG